MSEQIDMRRSNDGEFRLDSNVMLQIHESEINQQIATAKKFPRATGSISREIEGYATETEEAAQECIYALPRGGKVIMGPTARFAEMVATSWGNSRYAARIIDETAQFVVAQAVFHDLEKNNFISIEVQRRIVKADGKRYDADMIGVTSAAAMSIAMRNAILKGVPKSVWGKAYDKAHALIAGTFETVEARRGSAIKHFAKLGVTQDLVLQLLNRKSVADIEPADIVTLRGTLQAIKDGDTTVRSIFGVLEGDGQQGDKPTGTKADVAGHLKKGKEAHGKKTASEGGKPAGSEEDKTESENTSAEPSTVDRVGTEDAGSGVAGAGDNGGSVDLPDDGFPGTDTAGGVRTEREVLPPLPDGMIPPPSSFDPESGDLWETGSHEKLDRLARALLKANTATEVGKVSTEFLSMFEAGSTALEAAYASMVNTRRRDVRAGKSRL